MEKFWGGVLSLGGRIKMEMKKSPKKHLGQISCRLTNIQVWKKGQKWPGEKVRYVIKSLKPNLCYFQIQPFRHQPFRDSFWLQFNWTPKPDVEKKSIYRNFLLRLNKHTTTHSIPYQPAPHCSTTHHPKAPHSTQKQHAALQSTTQHPKAPQSTLKHHAAPVAAARLPFNTTLAPVWCHPSSTEPERLRGRWAI